MDMDMHMDMEMEMQLNLLFFSCGYGELPLTDEPEALSGIASGQPSTTNSHQTPSNSEASAATSSFQSPYFQASSSSGQLRRTFFNQNPPASTWNAAAVTPNFQGVAPQNNMATHGLWNSHPTVQAQNIPQGGSYHSAPGPAAVSLYAQAQSLDMWHGGVAHHQVPANNQIPFDSNPSAPTSASFWSPLLPVGSVPSKSPTPPQPPQISQARDLQEPQAKKFRPVGRDACDQCKRSKTRCGGRETNGTCSSCFEKGVNCTKSRGDGRTVIYTQAEFSVAVDYVNDNLRPLVALNDSLSTNTGGLVNMTLQQAWDTLHDQERRDFKDLARLAIANAKAEGLVQDALDRACETRLKTEITDEDIRTEVRGRQEVLFKGAKQVAETLCRDLVRKLSMALGKEAARPQDPPLLNTFRKILDNFKAINIEKISQREIELKEQREVTSLKRGGEGEGQVALIEHPNKKRRS